jgi:hypothetical protein
MLKCFSKSVRSLPVSFVIILLSNALPGTGPCSPIADAEYDVMKGTLVRLASHQLRLALSRNQGRGLILINLSESPSNAGSSYHNNFRREFRKTASLEDRMRQLESLVQAIPPAMFAASGISNFAGIMNSPDATLNATMASSPHTYPPSLPPPSLNTFPLINPSTHFPSSNSEVRGRSPTTTFHSLSSPVNTGPQSAMNGPNSPNQMDQLADDTSRLSLSPSYLYLDDEGYTRWQGETSGLPLLDLLVERHAFTSHPDSERRSSAAKSESSKFSESWFPDRSPKRTDINPETMWRLVTSFITPDLMDRSLPLHSVTFHC